MATYKATIIGNGLAESKEKKTPSIHIMLKAEFDLETKEAVDKTFYADLWLSENAKQNTINTLRAIGFEGNSIAELNTPCLVGYEVEVSTYWEDYNGRQYEKVNFINAIGSFAKRGMKPIEDSKAKSLASRYDSLFLNTKPIAKPSINMNAVNAANAATNASQSAGAPAAPNYNTAADEDLPF